MRLLTLTFALSASIASAQPQTLPMFDGATGVTYAGSFTLPTNDGAGQPAELSHLTYGGFGLGLGPNGSLYYGCHDWHNRLARVSIPSPGGVATILEPCTAIPNLAAMDNGNTDNVLGGSLWYNNRLIVSGYAYYDAVGDARASHFAGPGIGSLVGPVTLGVGIKPATVGGQMTLIPPEWRALLGGPVLTGLCCTSIISRSSYGPSVSVFDPDTLTAAPTAPATQLLRYDETPAFAGSESWRSLNAVGIAFPAGTRTVLFLGREGSNFCYGIGVNDPALHNTLRADGALNCYNPFGLGNHGFHGYPYKYALWAYDANHLIEVKAGTRSATSLQPVAKWPVPALEAISAVGAAPIRSAAYDSATGVWYVVTEASGATPRVHILKLTVPAPPPPPPPPAATLTLALTDTKTTCKVEVSAQPPDATGGWGVQFTLNGANLSTRDTSAPFSRTKSGVLTGAIVAGQWTKSGTAPRPITPQTVVCP